MHALRPPRPGLENARVPWGFLPCAFCAWTAALTWVHCCSAGTPLNIVTTPPEDTATKGSQERPEKPPESAWIILDRWIMFDPERRVEDHWVSISDDIPKQEWSEQASRPRPSQFQACSPTPAHRPAAPHRPFHHQTLRLGSFFFNIAARGPSPDHSCA